MFTNHVSDKGLIPKLHKEFVQLKQKNKTLKMSRGSSHRGAAETNLTSNHEVVGSIPGLTQGVKDLGLL